jgi:hypothetical protein
MADSHERAARRQRRRWRAHAAAAAALALCAAAPAAAQAPPPPAPPPFACLPARSAAACAALGDLYAATGGPGWANSTGWASAVTAPFGASVAASADFCAFDGVTCDAAGDVTALCVRAHAAAGRRGARWGAARARHHTPHSALAAHARSDGTREPYETPRGD